MKFMKLGSKLDTFQTDEDDVRIAVTDYATDFTVNVGDVKFYLHKVHREMSKSERKTISGLMDCRRLSAKCREHAVQNEFLPTRTLVQILLCTCSSGSSQLIAPTIVEDNSNMVSKVEDLKTLKLAGGGVGSYRSTSSSSNSWSNQIADDKGNGKVKALFGPKNMLSKLWSGESSSDTSNSSGMANPL